MPRRRDRFASRRTRAPSSSRSGARITMRTPSCRTRRLRAQPRCSSKRVPRSRTRCGRAARWSRYPTRRARSARSPLVIATRFRGPVVAITGSNGKTTTKEMCAAILAVRAPCLKTEGNLNNQFGLPLTLLRCDDPHRAAVVEIGMNHRGRNRPARGDRTTERRPHHQRRHRAHRESRFAGRNRAREGRALRGTSTRTPSRSRISRTRA